MTLNTVKPRSAITRFSPSMVCATDVLLGLVTTPSEDSMLSGIRLPFEGRRSCARLQEQVVSDSRRKGDELLGVGREAGEAAVGVVQEHQVPAPRGLALAKPAQQNP